ncbi:MAG TPA: gamma-glutamyl-gamma-aminobutyrate hydrolase family protein [Terriglobales bacterium]|nr:gamma-glutamyl-gamma-aminobutyrate hydrolase family protein [Terriglobales bacterium]
MKPRIAIPWPHSANKEYSERGLPQYEQAVREAGGEPVRIPLDRPAEELIKLFEGCDGVLLPGSRADVDPGKYGEARDPHTSPADPLRYTADQLLLQNAHHMRKPLLGICYGLQILNVYRRGTLQQHIESTIDHTARDKTHAVQVDPVSLLASILGNTLPQDTELRIEVNTSHHQAAAIVGSGLRVAAQAPDGVVEALEGTSPEHFVLAVQWHPERSLNEPASQAIFCALVEAARARHRELAGEFESLPK